MGEAEALERKDSAAGTQKSPKAFRTISEVSEEIGVPQHVLRFWESKFPEVSPVKRRGGRRYYRPEDIDILQNIKTLLYKEGFTIKGARKQVSTVRRRGTAEKTDNTATPMTINTAQAVGPKKEPEVQRKESTLEGIFQLSQADVTKHRDALKAVLDELCEARDLLKPYCY